MYILTSIKIVCSFSCQPVFGGVGWLPGGASGKEPACQGRRHKRLRFDPWVRKIPLDEGMGTCSSILV